MSNYGPIGYFVEGADGGESVLVAVCGRSVQGLTAAVDCYGGGLVALDDSGEVRPYAALRSPGCNRADRNVYLSDSGTRGGVWREPKPTEPTALLCSHCTGLLPRPVDGYADCPYCGAVNRI